MSLRVLANYIFGRHLTQGRFGVVLRSVGRYYDTIEVSRYSF